jgi:hypothetical protein
MFGDRSRTVGLPVQGSILTESLARRGRLLTAAARR